jgi:hypothetical protein
MIGPFALWPSEFTVVGTVALLCYVVLATCAALEATEAACALAWPRHVLPELPAPSMRRRVAVLMTICGDASDRGLAALSLLAAIGRYDVFVLDDSPTSIVLPEDLADRCHHVRRRSHFGAKAGNLNHWLARFGDHFDFALLLDADSIVSARTLERLLAAADHPANRDVAVFQAKIAADRHYASVFAGLVADGAAPRARVLERVHARFGLLLSFGHNQLLRLAAVRGVGFDESLAAEDTALTLALAARGWRVGLVDAWSFDRDPGTIATFNRRTVRWAMQTAELFSRDWHDVPLRLKLLMCRHLLGYLSPIAGSLLLFVLVYGTQATPQEVLRFLHDALVFQEGYAIYGGCLLVTGSAHLSAFILRCAVALSEGIAVRRLLAGLVLGHAYILTLVPPLTVGLVGRVLGQRVVFVPTFSARALHGDLSRRTRLQRVLTASLLWVPLLVGVALHPGSLLVGFNLLWISMPPLSAAALLVLERHRSGRMPGGGSR